MKDADHPNDVYDRLSALKAAGSPCVLVIVAEALGSTPQDAGAKMIVTPAGLDCGTVGGGRLEAKAIGFAQGMLETGALRQSTTRFENWTLKGDVGMTCGGSVKLYFEAFPGVEAAWRIAIFGSGHVTQALVPVLQPLACRIAIYDSRPEWLQRLPRSANVAVHEVVDLAAAIEHLAPDTFVLCMTQGHKTDRPILLRALSTRAFPFLGCIGSEAKALVLRRELVEDGLSPARAAEFHCPVGLDFGTNHPHEIALSIAAQLLTERDRWQQATPTPRA